MLGKATSELFSKRVWFSESARADYSLLLLNQLFLTGIAPRLLSKLVVATLIFEALHIWMDGRVILWPTAPGWTIGVMFTLVLFLLDDFTKYLVHRTLHRWPVLWCFHKVHHTAEVLTPFTVYRTHPVEAIIFSLRSILVHAVAVAGFLFFFGDRAELVTILSANIFLFLFNVAGSNLRHSHVWISYGSAVERWLISPAQHQIHHSIEERHYDQNFGFVLSVWDRFGGSLTMAEANKPAAYGVEGETASHNLITLYFRPFREAANCLFALCQKVLSKMKTALSFARNRWAARSSALLLLCLGALPFPLHASELNIYSHRQPFLIEPFLNAYTEQTGTKINVVYASRGLAQRLLAEGDRSPADIVLTVDIARLYSYADKDLLATVESDVLRKNIPDYLRDPDNRWFAFSKRARVIAVSKKAEDADGIGKYEDLADPKWTGRICVRPGSHVYNRALVASLLHHLGAKEAETWVSKLVGNLAQRPQGNDRAQVKAIYEGLCDIAIINNYYFGKLTTSDVPVQREWADAVNLVFPNQAGRGTHINISGGGVAKHSKNKDEAIRFLEFLTSEDAQKLYGSVNFEYPVNPSVELTEELKSLGAFKEDDTPIANIAELAIEAQKVIDRGGW
ncbi:MAG: extracellular solute-binding protein [Hyphomicrobiales bacterium]|nr:extracellular solute-binding protein [Hyphomicrobiales bacterium]